MNNIKKNEFDKILAEISSEMENCWSNMSPLSQSSDTYLKLRSTIEGLGVAKLIIERVSKHNNNPIKLAKTARKRQLFKNEALNKIRKICHPSYNVPMVEVSEFYSDHTRSIYTESREEPIMDVIKRLNRELSKLNNRNNK